MVVKFFSNKKGGSVKAIDYLLNGREKDGTARVLIGDEQLTRNIINDISFKHKVCVGCLSFEEQNIDEDLKYKIMSDFEKHLLPSLDSDQYNILWVEHVDKGRLELNFVIPKIELTRKISLNPFYHKQDLSRVDTWQNLTNLTYNFTDPKDPAKERTLQGASKKISLQKDYEKLDVTLHELVKNGQIQNRDQMIELLNQNEIFVNRVGSDYISIKLPDSKKTRRYKGGIYNEEFRSIGELKNISENTKSRIDEYNNRSTSREISFYTSKLTGYTESKANYNRTKYSKKYITKKQTSININGNIKFNFITYDNDILFSLANSNQRFTSLANSLKFTIHRAKSKVYKSIKKRDTSISRPNNNIYQNQGIKNDSIGTAIKSGVCKSREAQYRAYLKNRKTRNGIYKQIVGDAENLRVKLREYSEQQHKNNKSIFTKIGNIGRIIAKLASELKSRIKSIKIVEVLPIEKLDSTHVIANEFNKKKKEVKIKR